MCFLNKEAEQAHCHEDCGLSFFTTLTAVRSVLLHLQHRAVQIVVVVAYSQKHHREVVEVVVVVHHPSASAAYYSHHRHGMEIVHGPDRQILLVDVP